MPAGRRTVDPYARHGPVFGAQKDRSATPMTGTGVPFSIAAPLRLTSRRGEANVKNNVASAAVIGNESKMR